MSRPALPKILLVDADPMAQRFYTSALKGKVDLIIADKLGKARKLFSLLRDDLALIGMEACIPFDGEAYTTAPLIRYMRESGYKGQIIALSTNAEYRHCLMRDGCDAYVRDKTQMIDIVHTYLAAHDQPRPAIPSRRQKAKPQPS